MIRPFTLFCFLTTTIAITQDLGQINDTLRTAGNPPSSTCEAGCNEIQRDTRMLPSYSTLDSASCSRFIGTQSTAPEDDYYVDIFSVTKTYNPKNVLKYAVKLNSKCEIIGGPTPYWVMGESSRVGGKITCAGVASGEESTFFNPTGRRATTSSVSYSLGVLTSDKVNSAIEPLTFSPTVTTKASVNGSNICSVSTTGTIHKGSASKKVTVRTLNTVISFMSISRLEVNGTDVTTLLR